MDRLTLLHAFVRLVELGTFTAVADELRVKQSTVSKWIAELEEQLGVQLIERTTRTRRVTESGRIFYERATEILSAYESATAAVQEQAPELRGRLRISVPVVFGRLFVVPRIADFLAEHEALEVELVYSDRYVNLIEERIDVAIRVGLMEDSSFTSRKLAETGRRLVASPEYLDRHGEPEQPGDLKGHACLLHTGLSNGDVWSFRHADGQIERASVRGRIAANNSEAILHMAQRGLGIALLAAWLVEGDLKSGALVELLPDLTLPPAPINAVMPPRRFVHPRVRRFIDFMVAAFAEEFTAR